MEKLIESVTVVIELYKNYLQEGVLSKEFALGSVQKFVNVLFSWAPDPEAKAFLEIKREGVIEWACDIIDNLQVGDDEQA